jgi:hypothetical protein
MHLIQVGLDQLADTVLWWILKFSHNMRAGRRILFYSALRDIP